MGGFRLGGSYSTLKPADWSGQSFASAPPRDAARIGLDARLIRPARRAREASSSHLTTATAVCTWQEPWTVPGSGLTNYV